MNAKTKVFGLVLTLFSYLLAGALVVSPAVLAGSDSPAAGSAEARARTYCNERYGSLDTVNANLINSCISSNTQRYQTAIDTCNGREEAQLSAQRYESCVTGEFSSPDEPIPNDSAGGVGTTGLPLEGDYDCQGVDISIDVNCTDATNPILAYLGGIANFLSVGVGIVLVLSLIILGIQYITSKGDPQLVKTAKDRAFNIALAGLTYFFIYAILKWLVPGGF